MATQGTQGAARYRKRRAGAGKEEPMNLMIERPASQQQHQQQQRQDEQQRRTMQQVCEALGQRLVQLEREQRLALALQQPPVGPLLAPPTPYLQPCDQSQSFFQDRTLASQVASLQGLSQVAAAIQEQHQQQRPVEPRQKLHLGRQGRKCRKVYGMEQRQLWCTQCKWKKACSRFCNQPDQQFYLSANTSSRPEQQTNR